MRNHTGFTLIEIMVVITIIGILATLVIVNIDSIIGKPPKIVTRANLKSLVDAIERFRLDNRVNPEKLDDLVTRPSNATDWPAGGYVAAIPKDGWDRDFVYRKISNSSASAGGYELISYGADGKPGGSGENEDLSSRNR